MPYKLILKAFVMNIYKWFILGVLTISMYSITEALGVKSWSAPSPKAISRSLEIYGHGYNLRLCRYHLEPSQHYFYHYNFELRSHDVIMSPATENCEADEDFIGRVCRLARCVHASTTTLRVLERHLIKCYFEFEEIKLSWNARKKQF